MRAFNFTADDTINGNEGTLQAILNGRVEEMAMVDEFEANVELNKVEVQILGSRWTHHKVTGMTGTGNMRLKYITSQFRQMVVEYGRTGRMPQISLIGTNDDPASTVGRQTVALRNVLIDGTKMFALNSDKDILDEEIGFTFTDVEVLEAFRAPTR